MKKFALLLSLLIFSITTFAQEETTSYQLSNKGVIKTITDEEGEKSYNVLKPILMLKSKYELGTEEGYSRFTVRNSRLGVQGDLNSKFTYKFMVDWAADGKFSVLDLYATYKPSNRISFTLGQQGLSLYNSWTISPNALDYVNRPFVGKYFISSRDMGLSMKLALKKEGFPINLELGVYNGSGINNPTWNKALATGGRLEFGSTKQGFRASAKFYNHKNDDSDDMYYGGDLRYENAKFKVEAEYLTKKIGSSVDGGYNPDFLSATYVESLLKLGVKNKSIKRIEPALRWDAMGYDVMDRGFGVNRLTAGVNMVLNTGVVNSVVRLNYEQYFNSKMDLSALFKTTRYNENKLSLELLIVF